LKDNVKCLLSIYTASRTVAKMVNLGDGLDLPPRLLTSSSCPRSEGGVRKSIRKSIMNLLNDNGDINHPEVDFKRGSGLCVKLTVI
jgi:hypothetical protein